MQPLKRLRLADTYLDPGRSGMGPFCRLANCAALANIAAVKSNHLVVGAAQMKFRPTIAGNVAWIQHTIQTAGAAGVDVLLFPECAVTGYNRDVTEFSRSEIDDALGSIAQSARSAHCNVLVGSPTFTGRKRLNSLVVFDRRGHEVFRYAKIHLTARDARFFAPGNRLAFFHLDGVACTAIICHERRYPELVRLPVMMGAQIAFHPNAGLDALAVSKAKRGGRDGIAVRAFENQIFYVFANSVGPQGDGLWSAGDSKIVAPDSRVLALANNRDEMLIRARINLKQAGGRYAREALSRPAFLRAHWKAMLAACRHQLARRQ